MVARYEATRSINAAYSSVLLISRRIRIVAVAITVAYASVFAVNDDFDLIAPRLLPRSLNGLLLRISYSAGSICSFLLCSPSVLMGYDMDILLVIAASPSDHSRDVGLAACDRLGHRHRLLRAP